MSGNDPFEVLELVRKEVAEARADEARKACADVCSICQDGESYTRKMNKTVKFEDGKFWHYPKVAGGREMCAAGMIHERLHREKAEKEKKGKKVVEILHRKKYRRNPSNGAVVGWGTKWLP